MKKINAFYRDLRLKQKMFLLISFILLCFTIGGLFILQYAFNVYNEEIYRQSAQSLRVSSASIENELKKMERLSYEIATDQYIQTHLLELKNSRDEYERFLISAQLEARLFEIGAYNKYVDSLQIYDATGEDYTVGNRIVTIDETRLDNIQRETTIKEGGITWIFPMEADSSFIAAREINSYQNFSFERLGMVAVRFNMEGIISAFSDSLSDQGAKLLVFNTENELVFPYEPSPVNQYMVDSIEGTDGYDLLKYKGESYFATFSPASYTSWTYMIISPYGSLFQAVSSVRTAVLIIYFSMFFLLMLMGKRFAGGITGPIESLNKKMRRVQAGGFNQIPIEEKDDFQFAKDEAGHMHDNFNKMMRQLNFLLDENYKKQLVIKESEFRALQAQINPHFLYNTLESINWAAKMGGNKDISRMAESLGYILRSSLDTKEPLVTLAEELKIIEHYITIQSCRFEERLAFSNRIPDSLLSCKVPKFSLQPLVENAIRYGLQQKVGTCTITIGAKYSIDYVVIIVEDDGPGMEKKFLKQLASGDYEANGTGIGLKNINERLGMLFGEAYGIEVESEKNKGTRVHMLIPYEGGMENVSSAAGR